MRLKKGFQKLPIGKPEMIKGSIKHTTDYPVICKKELNPRSTRAVERFDCDPESFSSEENETAARLEQWFYGPWNSFFSGKQQCVCLQSFLR